MTASTRMRRMLASSAHVIGNSAGALDMVRRTGPR